MLTAWSSLDAVRDVSEGHALTAAEVVHRRLDGCCLHAFEIHAVRNRLELPAWSDLDSLLDKMGVVQNSFDLQHGRVKYGERKNLVYDQLHETFQQQIL